MPAAEFSSLISTALTLKELGVALVGERDRHKAAAIEADFTKRLLEIQTQLMQVLGAVVEKDQTINTLLDRVRKLEADKTERDRYRLTNVGTVGQFVAYELRPAVELQARADEPPHFLCQPCFDAGKKSVLRINHGNALCSVCKRNVTIGPTATVQPVRSHNPFSARDW